jgi:hypothetical protein
MFNELRENFGTGAAQSTADEELFTDKALLQRDAIRYSPRIMQTLREAFRLVDIEDNNCITKLEYTNLSARLYMCLRAYYDRTLPELSEEQSAHIAEEDWANDFQKRKQAGSTNAQAARMHFKEFSVSMFQLCDIWTDGISEGEYFDFLTLLFDRLAYKDADGQRRLKSTEMLQDDFIEQPYRLHLEQNMRDGRTDESDDSNGHTDAHEEPLHDFDPTPPKRPPSRCRGGHHNSGHNEPTQRLNKGLGSSEGSGYSQQRSTRRIRFATKCELPVRFDTTHVSCSTHASCVPQYSFLGVP